MKKRALISVSDKTGVVELAKELQALGYEIVSTGGTAKLLELNGLETIKVEDVTNFPECLDGRVKTLHPNIFAGILAIGDNETHTQTLKNLNIATIDIVVVNLYPFAKVIKDPTHTLEQAVENIDIGGPSMIRAAAKNHGFTLVVTDVAQYNPLLERLKNDQIDDDFRFELAAKAFAHTAAYDALIAQYLLEQLERKQDTLENFPETLTLTFNKKQALRYGENPHQAAAYYEAARFCGYGIESAQVIHGKELSYNNINDAQAAVALAKEFDEPVCVAIKHATPCGVAVGKTALEAFEKAFDADPVSIFGGIVCVNIEVDELTAEKMSKVFLEVIIAPSYSEKALECLKQKANLRIMILDLLAEKEFCGNQLNYKNVGGGLLVQRNDDININKRDIKIVTKTEVNNKQIDDLLFAMKVVKHVKSNAIVVAKDGQTIGISGGETSRIWACKAALERAGEQAKDAVIASDAFFPFADVVEACKGAEICAIIQPGGSKNDNLSIDKCNEFNIPMAFTNVRHFRH